MEITKEQVNFAGQTTETEEAKAEPEREYLPPGDTDTDENVEENTDGLRVQGIPQGLPAEDDSAQFNEPESDNQVNQQYRLPNNQQFGRLRQPQFPRQRNFNFNPQQQFGRLVQQPNFQQFQQRQQFTFARQEAPAAPAREYGPPRNAPVPTDNEDQDSQEEEQPSVSVSNSIQRGRYYVLTPDNTLQRVNFQTSQSEEEARTNGFTAQLKYKPVQPIREPIYAYNDQGVLVRIHRK